MPHADPPKADPAAPLAPPTRFVADNMQAIWWILLSVFGASAMTLGVRLAAVEIHPVLIVALRAGLIALVMLAMISSGNRQVRITRPWLHLLRGSAIAVSTVLGFIAITKLELVTATVLFFMGPIWATIFGVILHGERTGPRRIGAILVGFLGVLVVLRPGIAAFEPGMLYALGSSLLFGFALPLSREVSEADGTFCAYFSSVVTTLAITLPFAIPYWSIPVQPAVWIGLAAVIVFSALRGVADLQAYRIGEAAVLAPFNYLRLVLIGFGAYLLMGEIPDFHALLGACLIVAAAIYIAHRERKAS